MDLHVMKMMRKFNEKLMEKLNEEKYFFGGDWMNMEEVL